MANFPIKKEGDGLGAEHVNWLTAGVRKSEAFRVSGYNMNGSSVPPIDIRTFDVVEVGCDGNPDLYRIVSRYWDIADQTWKSGNKEDNRGFSLDATDTGQVFSVDDKTQAYYDSQRGAFIPLMGGSGVQQIRFELVDRINCATCQARARVLSRPPGVTRVFGEDVYGYVLVYDLVRGALNRPDVDLIDPVTGDGARGHASLLEWDFEECAIDPNLPIKWEIVTLWPLSTVCP